MSEAAPADRSYIARALELARRAWGQTHPNPMVGAVIVEGDQIVAEGWHAAAGQAHAEVAALKALGRAPLPDACLYVTLEPCSTCGRTGACTQAIIEAGFKRVVVGAHDPNPAHAGRGLSILRAAGIEVVEGVLAAECTDLNLIFNHWITLQTPLIAVKMALTLDGKFAAASGHSKWVTGELARADVMRWRRYFPAIAVGAGTVEADDPRLTARWQDTVWCPIRIVFDRSLRTLAIKPLPGLYTDADSARTILVCLESAPDAAKARAEALGLRLWCLAGHEGSFDWGAFRQRCAEAGIFGVYVETGPGLATALLEGGLADYCFVYQAPKFICDSAAVGIGSRRETQSMEAAFRLRDLQLENFGQDRLTRGFIDL
ncbi:MAG: bifunctional diaminohydroxyphosphoribosylaminopyrimidine deaminase/5-amino-6-(5-phosphoribosylamino)uracil reductase RibD [Puniceicoccaceae bacterium]|nr:MAG: bifunctional diaminohydroxyphosphoribosylaminopyrimidine deaminase/5-amino-6-(5-phosphoribosylamino)uracil reductase RibD [Puniceicoccaceae bacterium]